MGVPKATLPFGNETMLARVVRLLSEAVAPIVVVAAAEQPLPPLPVDVVLAYDRRPGRGPLEGLLAGLSALPAGVDAAYATSCDAPLLSPAFVRRMVELFLAAPEEARSADIPAVDIAVPEIDGFCHPLAAVYRRGVVETIAELLATDRLRPMFLFDALPTRRVTPSEWRDVDPLSASLENLNRPDDYLRALATAGIPAPADLLARFATSIEPQSRE